MLFKYITLAATFASMVNGAAINLEGRQSDQIAFCTITTTPSNLPNPESALLEEFILSTRIPYTCNLARGHVLTYTAVFNNEFQNDIPPGSGVIVRAPSIRQPNVLTLPFR